MHSNDSLEVSILFDIFYFKYWNLGICKNVEIDDYLTTIISDPKDIIFLTLYARVQSINNFL